MSARALDTLSPVPLARDDLAALAALARIELRDDETDTIRGEIATVVTYLARVQSAAAEPPAAPTPVRLRGDTPGPPLPRDEALAAAPDPAPPFFGVPPFIDDA